MSSKNKYSLVYANLSDNLKNEYNKKSARVIKGDTVKIMRGEYKGVEGKIEKINTENGRLSIEGVQREKIKGGQVKVQIHASNVQISNLNLDDKFRKNNIGNVKQNIKSSKKRTTKKKEKSEVGSG